MYRRMTEESHLPSNCIMSTDMFMLASRRAPVTLKVWPVSAVRSPANFAAMQKVFTMACLVTKRRAAKVQRNKTSTQEFIAMCQSMTMTMREAQ